MVFSFSPKHWQFFKNTTYTVKNKKGKKGSCRCQNFTVINMVKYLLVGGVINKTYRIFPAEIALKLGVSGSFLTLTCSDITVCFFFPALPYLN